MSDDWSEALHTRYDIHSLSEASLQYSLLLIYIYSQKLAERIANLPEIDNVKLKPNFV